MKTFKIFALMLPFLALPFFVNSATYYYMQTDGSIAAVEAVNASQALEYSSFNGGSIHTGVHLDTARIDLEVGEVLGPTYFYVDVNGNLSSVEAASVDSAFILTTDRHPNSGFWGVPNYPEN